MFVLFIKSEKSQYLSGFEGVKRKYKVVYWGYKMNWFLWVLIICFVIFIIKTS